MKRSLPLILAAMLLATLAQGAPIRKNIHEGWSFRQKRGFNSYPATVPGVVHTDLIDNGIIEDPFLRLNERGVQWVDKEDWIYRTTFDMDAATLARQNIAIIFEGLVQLVGGRPDPRFEVPHMERRR